MSFKEIGPVGRLIRILLRLRVASGPFAGMRYLKTGVYGAYLPRLLGTYEKEIWPAWARMTTTCRGGILINIGTAEGYYAVGALYSGAFDRAVCFERSEKFRELLGSLALLNGVQQRLEIHGGCEPAGLEQCLRENPGPIAVLCDVEGYENVLMDPESVPALARCHILVELHEAFCPGVTERLRLRFQITHHLELIAPAERRADDLPQHLRLLRLFPARNQLRWLHELRDAVTPWLYLTPRRG